MSDRVNITTLGLLHWLLQTLEAGQAEVAKGILINAIQQMERRSNHPLGIIADMIDGVDTSGLVPAHPEPPEEPENSEEPASEPT